MDEYKLNGFYKFVQAPSGIGKLEGSILLKDDGSFEGRIYDHAHRSPEQFLKGYLLPQDDSMIWYFLKMNNLGNAANIAYRMHKKGLGVEGTYRGEWHASPYKLQYYDENSGLFLVSVDDSVSSFKDSAELVLKKK
ncbi:MAG: hypothetical protein KC535_03795 [Nanoarchaeota archaeon]|nr:hypothetical protein [Nanoarchaeota archaeon]